MINIQFEIDQQVESPNVKISKEIISSVLKGEGKSEANILVIFTIDQILSDLKKKFFNKDHLTDVIAFRMNAYEEVKVEGEIYISIPRVKKNAEEYGQSFSKELARIIIHGSLHLLNYDDATSNEKIRMTEKEDHYLNVCSWEGLL